MDHHYTSNNGLLAAFQLNGNGFGEAIDWDVIKRWTPNDDPIWVHLDRTHEYTEEWLRECSGLTETTVDALLAEETRPRVFRGKKGTIAILRGVNLNPGEDEENMIDLRIWSEGNRVITLRRDPLQSVRHVIHDLENTGEGPESVPELFVRLIINLGRIISPTVEMLKERLENFEKNFDFSELQDFREELKNIRNKSVSLRRYLAPQRIAINELIKEKPKWADSLWEPRLVEAVDSITYYIEELDAVRDHSIIIKDDIANYLSESANKTLYALAVLSGIFLPLSFITGLLGINVGGMPGVDSKWAFGVVCFSLVVIGYLEIYILKKLKWI